MTQKKSDAYVAREWAKITEHDLIEMIVSYGLQDTLELRESVRHMVRGVGSNVTAIDFEYAIHGMFQDMGVSRGNPIGMSRLRRKGWYSKTMFRRVNALAEIMFNRVAAEGMAAFDNIPRVIEV